MSGDALAVLGAQLAGDIFHLGMAAPARGIIVHLPVEIAETEIGEARRAGAVAGAVEAVAGEAGIGCPGAAAAQRDQFAGGGKRIAVLAASRAAACREAHRRDRQAGRHGSFETPSHHGSGTSAQTRCSESATIPDGGSGVLMIAARAVPATLLLLAACKPPPDGRHHMPGADAAAGRAVVERVGCATCHDFPDISWPRGAVGPALDGFSGQALIVGRIPNRPDLLAAFVRDAPAIVPGAAMPTMPITEKEARDVAAYLYTLDGD
jgi:cytochrome c2